MFSIVCIAYLHQEKGNDDDCADLDNTAFKYSLGISATVFTLSFLSLVCGSYFMCTSDKKYKDGYCSVDMIFLVLLCILEIGSCFALCPQLEGICSLTTPHKIATTLVLKLFCAILLVSVTIYL